MVASRWLACSSPGTSPGLAAALTRALSVAHQRTSQERSNRLRSMISMAFNDRSVKRWPRKSISIRPPASSISLVWASTASRKSAAI